MKGILCDYVPDNRTRYSTLAGQHLSVFSHDTIDMTPKKSPILTGSSSLVAVSCRYPCKPCVATLEVPTPDGAIIKEASDS
jgi:hypothetical protein